MPDDAPVKLTPSSAAAAVETLRRQLERVRSSIVDDELELFALPEAETELETSIARARDAEDGLLAAISVLDPAAAIEAAKAPPPPANPFGRGSTARRLLRRAATQAEGASVTPPGAGS